MDLRWQLIASLLRRGSQSINLGQWVKQMGRLVCPAGGGWRCELWLPQDCLETLCCVIVSE